MWGTKCYLPCQQQFNMTLSHIGVTVMVAYDQTNLKTFKNQIFLSFQVLHGAVTKQKN